ncbi:acyl-CoA dehydrogenase family protein [Novosphingobium cyanobacteriorum]|uniref:Acyl-CoA dehydrogenase family protein n=1 Tax=Novosphingobium cyanobacteriorum TaxID=3024215 RepID=A0ABT6CPE6_9SPHN|nr:acyl-CoA dehydrogenase family protein [Novosphingobium cyanobacteriorum]MDF8335671.1 acyl-CoA dehydrogenase family protein [Novosphingobium cyanobacteriorum]
MDLNWTPREVAFESEVRAFFAENLTDELRKAGSLMTSVYADHELGMQWQAILNKKGWAAPSWAVEHGGQDWSTIQHYIFSKERVKAGAPPVSPMGIHMVAHVIAHFGTPEQKDYFLPRILSGEHFWCQGYSEPGSGSDLASLQMAAVDDGDDFVCNGSKIWTTHAGEANWIFCLVRTSRDGKPQEGITFLLIPMDTPGIDVRPLVMTSGEEIQNQVFFENVRVPKANVLGEIGKGWTVAKYLLEFERGGQAYSPELQVRLVDLTKAAAALPGDTSQTLLDDPLFASRLAEARIRVDVLEIFEMRILSAVSDGGSVGVLSSVMKVMGTELSQHITELTLEAAGAHGTVYQPHATRPGGPVVSYTPPADNYVSGEVWQAIAPLRYMNERAGSIYAGSNEIQRNILAKTALGL